MSLNKTITFRILSHTLVFTMSIVFLILSGCKTHVPGTGTPKGGYLSGDGPPEESINVDAIADAVPKAEAKSRYGNPETYSVHGKKFNVMKKSAGYQEKGFASWYGKKWHGRRTSSGEKYDVAAMTGAHRTLPLPSYVRVTNLENGHKVVVKINDRGPFHGNRLIDLSYAAAAKLKLLAKGTAHVMVEALHPHQGPTTLLAKADTPATTGAPIVSVAQNTTDEEKYLQFGSFSYKENALALVREIEGVTQKSPAVKSVQVGNQPYYQVKLGPIRKDTEVESLLQQIASAGLSKPLVTHHA